MNPKTLAYIFIGIVGLAVCIFTPIGAFVFLFGLPLYGLVYFINEQIRKKRGTDESEGKTMD